MYKFLKTNRLVGRERVYRYAKYEFLSERFSDRKDTKYEKFRNETKKSEKFIYLITDRYSVKPDKEIKLIKYINQVYDDSEKLKEDQITYTYKTEINKYNKINYFLPQNIFSLLKGYTKTVFLPREYPNSVRPGYLHFMNYSFLSGICFHTMTFISTQVLINTLGITASQNESMTLSAGLNWVIKDSVGQIGSILFSARYSNSIEMNIKQWRLISLYIYDLGILLEISTMLQPSYFLLIASISTIFKVCAFLAFSSTRTGIINHFALENNITDLSNKSQAQSNLSFIFGNVIGVLMSINMTMTFNTVLLTILSLSAVHLVLAHMSNRNINLLDFNLQRAYYVVEEYLKNRTILDPITVNRKESVFFNRLKFLSFCDCSIDKLIKSEKNSKYMDSLVDLYCDSKFLTYVEKKYSYVKRKYKFKIYTFLRLDAENIDIFIAFIYSLQLYINIIEQYSIDTKSEDVDNTVLNVMKSNLSTICRISKTDLAKELKEKGWSLNFRLLENKYLRYHIITRQ